MVNYNILYSIPYLVVAIILLLLYRIDRSRSIKNHYSDMYLNIALVVLIFFIGFRGHLYTDFVSYYPFFEKLPNIVNLSVYNFKETSFEPGYFFYTSVLKLLIPDYYVWVIVNTIIDLCVLKWFFKRYTQSAILTFFIFFAYWGLQYEFNLYRNVKALMFFLISFRYLEKGKFGKYFLLNLIGSLFHTSSLIYIFCYPIFRLKIKNIYIILILTFVNVLYFSNIFLSTLILKFASEVLGDVSIDKLYSHISNSSEIGFSLGYFERTAEVLLFVYWGEKLKKIIPSYHIFLNMYIVYYCIYLLLSDVSIFVQRFPLLFIVSYWILLSNLFYIKHSFRKIIVSIIIILSLYRVYSSNLTIISKYDNILFGIESFEMRRHDSIQATLES